METILENSKIITLGRGSPVVSIVGLLHGNEPCGGQALDSLHKLEPQGTVQLIYANLEAQRRDVREVDSNLNRVFPGDKEGNLEERTAYQLRPYLENADFVLDIHSTSYPSVPFAISVEDSVEFDRVAASTGLGKLVIMTEALASGGSLIDYVNAHGGVGLSFEAGTHQDERSSIVAQRVVNQFLAHLGVIDAEPTHVNPDKYYATEVVRPAAGFQAYTLKPFHLLEKGVPYGISADGVELSLDYDSYPFLVTENMIDGKFFVAATKANSKYKAERFTTLTYQIEHPLKSSDLGDVICRGIIYNKRAEELEGILDKYELGHNSAEKDVASALMVAPYRERAILSLVYDLDE